MRTVLCLLFVAACSKQQVDETKWGDPVGIELAGEDLMAAVAVEAGHTLENAAVPEIASALAGVTKACPDVKGIGTNSLSIRMSAKDGALVSPADAKMDPLGQCVAKALDGKPATKLGNTRVLIQLVGKDKK